MGFDPISYIMGAKNGEGGGGGVTVEPITITENGTKTAPAGKAFSPVTVAVESDVLPFQSLKQYNTAYYDENETDIIQESIALNVGIADFAPVLENIQKALSDGNYAPSGYLTYYSWLQMIHADQNSVNVQDFYYILFFVDAISRISPNELFSAVSANVNTSVANIKALIPHDNDSNEYAEQMATIFYWLFVLLIYGCGTDEGLNDDGVAYLIWDYEFSNTGALAFSEMRSAISDNVNLQLLQSTIDTVIVGKDISGLVCYLKLIAYNAYKCIGYNYNFNSTQLKNAVNSILSM